MSVTSTNSSPDTPQSRQLETPRARPIVGVIAGATATGKSAVALEVAAALRGTIINADASQLYADLRVLTARPGDEETARVPHRLYGSLDGAEVATAAGWATLARQQIATALAEDRLPLLVGGTGLYLRTLIDGIAPVPSIADAVRDAVRGLDPDAARRALEAEDPDAARRLAPADRQRTLRALEVVRGTGRSLADWQRDRSGGLRDTHDVRAVVVTRPRAALYARCDARVDAMLAGGALDEVARLLARRLPDGCPVLRAIGVAPLSAVLDGSTDLATARQAIAQDTRRYAKRQSTWWQNQTPNWLRIDPELNKANEMLSKLFTKSQFYGP